MSKLNVTKSAKSKIKLDDSRNYYKVELWRIYSSDNIIFQKASVDVVAIAKVVIPKYCFEEKKFKVKPYRLGKCEIDLMTYI